MILALWIGMTGAVDRRGDLLAEHQPRPVRIEAILTDKDLNASASFAADVKHQDAGRRFGIRLVSALPIISDMARSATTILAHDVGETDWSLRLCRAVCGGRPEWIRESQERIDTAEIAAAAMGDGITGPGLSEATAALLGRSKVGAAALLELYARLRPQAAAAS